MLEWVDVVGPGGHRAPGRPEQLGFAYRRSSLRGRRGRRPGLASRSPRPPSDEVKATLADMRARRKAAQPSGIKTFGSTFKNPDDPRAEGRTAGQLLDAAGCRGLRIGGAGFSAKHANFVENHGDATTADVVAVMAEGRRRVKERFGVELEPEVQALGPVGFRAGLEAARVIVATADGVRLRVWLGRWARWRCARGCSAGRGCGCATPRWSPSSGSPSPACPAPTPARSARRWSWRRAT